VANNNNNNEQDEYYRLVAEDIGIELDKFEQLVLPVFLARGYSKSDALNYYSNRQTEEAIDELINLVSDNGGNSEPKEPWKN
jgi:hypothetical protein